MGRLYQWRRRRHIELPVIAAVTLVRQIGGAGLIDRAEPRYQDELDH
jgi:hypothetical protein